MCSYLWIVLPKAAIQTVPARVLLEVGRSCISKIQEFTFANSLREEEKTFKDCNICIVDVLYFSVSVPLKKNASATVSHFTSY